MFVRYRYRAYPTTGQAEMLARTFGCARVVFNDALRLRDAAHEAGEKITGTEVQRRVVTLAKATPEREWLSGIASVALVQACQDARRAYRNWFPAVHSGEDVKIAVSTPLAVLARALSCTKMAAHATSVP